MTTTTATTIWAIDVHHSRIAFKVKHLAIANVTGTFQSFHAKVESSNKDFDGAKVELELDVNSLTTHHTERDAHLRSDLFFNAEKFPQISFKGELKKSTSGYCMVGNLTIMETTKQITFQVEYNGEGKGRFNDIRAGFEFNGLINRKDYGLNFHMLSETGSLIVGEEVKFSGDIELIQQ